MATIKTKFLRLELENNNLTMNSPSPYKAKPWKRCSLFPIWEVRWISLAE